MTGCRDGVHQRQARRLRRLLKNTTRPGIKAHLAEEAGEHERLAVEQLEFGKQPIRRAAD